MKMAGKLTGHYILCGVGRQGRVIANEFSRTQREFVIVERSEAGARDLRRLYPKVPVIQGDASDEDVLEIAGLDRAEGLVCCLTDDRDNLLLVVTAKQIRPDIKIVCRVMDVQDIKKLNRAGADVVVSPTLIGGMRMASEMMRPAVTSFLDKMLRHKGSEVRVEEVTVPEQSSKAGRTLAELDVSHNAGMVVVAIQEAGSDDFEYAPTGNQCIENGMVLVVVGPIANIPKLKKIVA